MTTRADGGDGLGRPEGDGRVPHDQGEGSVGRPGLDHRRGARGQAVVPQVGTDVGAREIRQHGGEQSAVLVEGHIDRRVEAVGAESGPGK